jgi:tyrosine-protein kinase Etk/Wzc
MDEKELTLRDMWNIIWSYRKMIIKNVTVITIITVIITLLLPRWYKAKTVIMPPSSKESTLGKLGGILGGGLLGIQGGEEEQNRIMSILKSRSLLEQVAKNYNLIEKYDCDNLEETIKKMKDNLNIELGEELQISVSFWDKDQDLVADITNYIVKCLDSLNISLSTGKGSYSRKFVESRVGEVLDSLNFLEREMKNFMAEEGVLIIEDQLRAGVNIAAQIKAEIISKEAELAVVNKAYDKNSPMAKFVQSEVNNLRDKYNKFFNEQSDDKIIPNFDKAPFLVTKFNRLKWKIEYYLKVLEILAPEYESAKISETKHVPTIQIIDIAVRPERKDKPKRAKIVLVLFGLSLIFSSYYAYFRGRKKYIDTLSS